MTEYHNVHLGIWREALQNLIENDINEVASVAELDESVFLSSLQMHTKKRKFCSTCRDNIMFVYDNMLEEASNCSDCEEECDEEEEEEEEEEGEEEYEETEEGPLEAPKPHQKLHGNEIASVPNTNSTTAATSDYEYINERADNLDGRDTDQGRVISYARKSPGSLLACIKYCPERRKIAIPLEMEIFMEFLSKAESGSTTHTKHANTKEAAQEELVACIGSCLKERLQNIWRSKKSEELARILFMKLVADCVVDGIRQKLEEKNFRLGHKTILEEYLNETEAAEQQKKEKQRQKRQKRKEKKKILKQSETDNPGDTENNGDEERETGEENDGNVTDKDVGELNKIENKDQINYKKQEKKKKKKAKNKESSATYDKISTDSNTPETKKSIEKKDQVTGVKKSKKEIEEEEKLETKKSNEELGNIRNNRFMNNEERERRLLIAMGWNEELSENEAGVDEKEVKKLRDKWKEIEASRADFRKNAKEKFMRLLNSK